MNELLEPVDEVQALSSERSAFMALYKLEQHPALPVEQFARRGNDEGRARELLRMSDHMMLQYGQLLGELCQQLGFAEGADYCAVRLACLFAVRNDSGVQGIDQIVMTEKARQALVRFAGA